MIGKALFGAGVVALLGAAAYEGYIRRPSAPRPVRVDAPAVVRAASSVPQLPAAGGGWLLLAGVVAATVCLLGGWFALRRELPRRELPLRVVRWYVVLEAALPDGEWVEIGTGYRDQAAGSRAEVVDAVLAEAHAIDPRHTYRADVTPAPSQAGRQSRQETLV